MVEVTEFASPTGIAWQGDVGVVQYGGGDAGMVVIFYNRATHNPAKSAAAGRPIFTDVVFVRIHQPGERLNVIDRPATDDDRRRFPMQWQQFTQQKQQTPEGTPVDLLYPEQPAIAAMLRASHVHTIEHLANLSANAIENLGMGAQTHVNNARRYIEASAKGAGSTAARKQIEDLQSQLRVANEQIALLKSTVQQMQATQAGAPNLAQLQQMLAGVMQVPMQAPQIDGQAHMINNLHPTSEIAKAPKRKRPALKR